MTAREERQRLVDLTDAAHAGGARLAVACREAGITMRTLQRWRDPDVGIRADGRPDAQASRKVSVRKWYSAMRWQLRKLAMLQRYGAPTVT